MKSTSIGRTVRWARRRAGLTQHQLAVMLEMPQPSIARIERGSVMPRTSTLIAILEATGHHLTVEPLPPTPDVDAIRDRLWRSVPGRTHDAVGRRVAQNRESGPMAILRRLRRFNVPFVLVGELAEAAHGAPGNIGRTVEIVHATTDVAADRLAQARESLGTTASDTNRLRPVTETSAGDTYELLARTAVRLPVDAGIQVQVASVEDLIRARRARHSEEDARTAAILQAIADEADRA